MSSSIKLDRSYDQCHHTTCDKDARETGMKMRACSACGVARYCSKECQKSDWKNHKPACKNHQEVKSRLARMGGQDAAEMYERLNEWIVKHRPSLANAVVASLNLPKNPKAHQRLGLALDLTHILGEEEVPCCMEVNQVTHCDLHHMVSHNDAFKGIIDTRERYEAESVTADPDTYGTAVVILRVMHKFKPGAMRVLPITFSKGHAEETPPTDWKDQLLTKLHFGILGYETYQEILQKAPKQDKELNNFLLGGLREEMLKAMPDDAFEGGHSKHSNCTCKH